mgnify:CR=1 FL=1
MQVGFTNQPTNLCSNMKVTVGQKQGTVKYDGINCSVLLLQVCRQPVGGDQRTELSAALSASLCESVVQPGSYKRPDKSHSAEQTVLTSDWFFGGPHQAFFLGLFSFFLVGVVVAFYVQCNVLYKYGLCHVAYASTNCMAILT